MNLEARAEVREESVREDMEGMRGRRTSKASESARRTAPNSTGHLVLDHQAHGVRSGLVDDVLLGRAVAGSVVLVKELSGLCHSSARFGRLAKERERRRRGRTSRDDRGLSVTRALVRVVVV